MTKLNLRKVAQDVTTLSPLMNGREKIKTADLIEKFPNGVHITECDLAPNPKGEPYAVILFKESDVYYYCGGMILTKVVNGMLEACNNDFSILNKELAEDPIGVKLNEVKTSDGKNNLTTVEILNN